MTKLSVLVLKITQNNLEDRLHTDTDLDFNPGSVNYNFVWLQANCFKFSEFVS